MNDNCISTSHPKQKISKKDTFALLENCVFSRKLASRWIWKPHIFARCYDRPNLRTSKDLTWGFCLLQALGHRVNTKKKDVRVGNLRSLSGWGCNVWKKTLWKIRLNRKLFRWAGQVEAWPFQEIRIIWIYRASEQTRLTEARVSNFEASDYNVSFLF